MVVRHVIRDEHGRAKKCFRSDGVGRVFYRLAIKAKAKRHKAGFKTLRSMFRSLAVGSGASDDAIAVIMGRKFRHPMDEYYLRGNLKAELERVVKHVEDQLFPVEVAQQPESQKSGEQPS